MSWRSICRSSPSRIHPSRTKLCSGTCGSTGYNTKHGCGTLLFSSHSQEWSISNFPCSPTRIITSDSVKNLAFHSLLRSNMVVLPNLTTSRIHFFFKRLGECTFGRLCMDKNSPSFSALSPSHLSAFRVIPGTQTWSISVLLSNFDR